jgi:hypothetical protein
LDKETARAIEKQIEFDRILTIAANHFDSSGACNVRQYRIYMVSGHGLLVEFTLR